MREGVHKENQKTEKGGILIGQGESQGLQTQFEKPPVFYETGFPKADSKMLQIPRHDDETPEGVGPEAQQIQDDKALWQVGIIDHSIVFVKI